MVEVGFYNENQTEHVNNLTEMNRTRKLVARDVRKVESYMSHTVFAGGLGFYKLVLIFAIGAFLGDLIETIFCRLKFKKWMSRSSFLYGHFSAVWGLAFVLATILACHMENVDVFMIFAVGIVLGSLFEYMCSAVLENVIGAKFWDYSKFKHNLAGRINLKYSVLWGVAAVAWMKGIFPVINVWIGRIPMGIERNVGNLIFSFFFVDAVISILALKRYVARNTVHNSEIPMNSFWQHIDEFFPDERMEQIYPHMKICKKEEGCKEGPVKQKFSK